jgi:flagellar basal body rod protein FlgG
MDSAIAIAQSGLQAATRSLDVSANNVANSGTAGFQPSEAVPVEAAGGGVTTRVQPENNPTFEAQIDRNLIDLSSGTDLVDETVKQTLAAAAFQANLATLRTADEAQGSLINIVR